MTLRSSDLQSDSDLDSIRNSCDVFYIWTIGVNGFSMVFQISTIGINDFSNVFLQMNHCHWMDGLWLTIDIDGLSMVLVEVNGGSQKKAKTQKKHDLLKD